MSEPSQHFYRSQGLNLAYWTWGDTALPPLVLMHGGRDHARTWDRIAEAFCDSYHVVAPDLRGHGDSDWCPGSHYPLIDHVPDLITLISLLGGRVPVVGHSFGSAVTMIAAGGFPDKFTKIVDIEGSAPLMQQELPITPERLRKWTEDTLKMDAQTPRLYPSFEAAATRMREANEYLTEEQALHMARWGAREVEGGWTWKFDPRAGGRALADVRPEHIDKIWAEVTAPVLHLVGRKSRFGNATFRGRLLEAYFKNSRTAVIEDSGHWLHHEQLDATVHAIRIFLA